MEARTLWFGRIRVADDGVVIRSAFSEERIPYARISSVSVNKALGRLSISTSGQVRTVQAWSARSLPGIADAIHARLDGQRATTA